MEEASEMSLRIRVQTMKGAEILAYDEIGFDTLEAMNKHFAKLRDALYE